VENGTDEQHRQNLERFSRIERRMEDLKERQVRLEEHNLSLYGNGSGRRGYLENMEGRWAEKWAVQMEENRRQADWRHEIGGRIGEMVNQQYLQQGKSVVWTTVAAAAGSGLMTILAEVLRHWLK
jgi:hypothetical protein